MNVKYGTKEVVQKSKFFSIIANETKGLKKTEQLSLVRYNYQEAIHKRCLDVQRASRLDAAGVGKQYNARKGEALNINRILLVKGMMGSGDGREMQWGSRQD